MSEQEVVHEEAPAKPTVDLEALMTENASIKAKMEELLTEAKKAKAAKREIEEQSQIERERIAREKGDFEQLHRSSEERYQATIKELESMRSSIANEKRNNAAMKVAAELADGVNAELLSEFISRRLKYHEVSRRAASSIKSLTVSALKTAHPRRSSAASSSCGPGCPAPLRRAVRCAGARRPRAAAPRAARSTRPSPSPRCARCCPSAVPP